MPQIEIVVALDVKLPLGMDEHGAKLIVQHAVNKMLVRLWPQMAITRSAASVRVLSAHEEPQV